MNNKLDFSQFLEDYLNDAKEGFQSANNALLALEKDHSRTELLDEIIRVFHTLKSSSTMLGFSDIAELAHLSEDLLDMMRKNVTQETIDVIFEMTDTLEGMVKECAEKKSELEGEGRSKISDFRSRIAEMKEKMISQDTKIEPTFRNRDAAMGRANLPAIETIQTVRVHVGLLDSLFNLAGELIINKNRIDNILSETPNKELKSMLAAMQRL
ncbi:MAG: Hpt domain-containing protein, partial [Desulfobacterales bacterium]|nr:Hpt domain-containing protein [Desulfobacterales bacterium]